MGSANATPANAVALPPYSSSLHMIILICLLSGSALLGRLTAPLLSMGHIAPTCPHETQATSAIRVPVTTVASASSSSVPVAPSPLAADPPAHCGRTWPIRGTSTASGAVQSWGFLPSNCGAGAWAGPGSPDLAESSARSVLSACLANRRVFIWGNSVSRGFAFELPTLLDGAPTASREEQKGLCEKTGEQTDDRCTLAVGKGSTVAFRWINFMDIRPFQPKPSAPPMAEFLGPLEPMPDSCSSAQPRDCFARALRGATRDDVLLLVNIGYSYGLMDPHTIAARELGHWRRDHVRAFVADVRAVFPGTVVYMNTPPTLANTASSSWNNARLMLWSEIIMPLLLAETDWLVFDMWSVAADFVGTPLFAESVHMPGRLTQIGWAFLGQMLCFNGGFNMTG